MTAASNIQSMGSQLVRHHFSIDEYEEMIAHGILDRDDRVELLAGEIVEKMGEGSRHLRASAGLFDFL